MTAGTQVRRTTAAPEEVIVRISDSARTLELTLDEATDLALDILEHAYSVRAGDAVPVFSWHTQRQTESPRYRPTARAYSVVQPRFREVSIHLGRLQQLGKTKSYRNDNDVLVPVDIARVFGHQLITAARESAAGIYERVSMSAAQPEQKENDA